jgi:hypothetical protein
MVTDDNREANLVAMVAVKAIVYRFHIIGIPILHANQCGKGKACHRLVL